MASVSSVSILQSGKNVRRGKGCTSPKDDSVGLIAPEEVICLRSTVPPQMSPVVTWPHVAS